MRERNIVMMQLMVGSALIGIFSFYMAWSWPSVDGLGNDVVLDSGGSRIPLFLPGLR